MLHNVTGEIAHRVESGDISHLDIMIRVAL